MSASNKTCHKPTGAWQNRLIVMSCACCGCVRGRADGGSGGGGEAALRWNFKQRAAAGDHASGSGAAGATFLQRSTPAGQFKGVKDGVLRRAPPVIRQ